VQTACLHRIAALATELPARELGTPPLLAASNPAVTTCKGAACVPVIGTKVVFTNLARVIRGLFAMHALLVFFLSTSAMNLRRSCMGLSSEKLYVTSHSILLLVAAVLLWASPQCSTAQFGSP